MVAVVKKTISKKPAAKSAASKQEPGHGSTTAIRANASTASRKVSKQANAKSEATPKEKQAKEKVKKPKLVRDSFAMPESEYEVLRDMKKSCMKAGVDVKKSELLRVGVALLKKQTPADIQAALASLTPLKAGRPKKTV